MGRNPAQDFRDGILRELEYELRQRCIVWHSTEDRDDADSISAAPPISIEPTDRAIELLTLYALALEMDKRERDR